MLAIRDAVTIYFPLAACGSEPDAVKCDDWLALDPIDGIALANSKSKLVGEGDRTPESVSHGVARNRR